MSTLACSDTERGGGVTAYSGDGSRAGEDTAIGACEEACAGGAGAAEGGFGLATLHQSTSPSEP